MTVKQLRDMISNLPDSMEIILQKDPEGNGYSPLAGVDADCVYLKDGPVRGEVYSLSWSADDACISEEEWEIIKSKPKSLVMHPMG